MKIPDRVPDGTPPLQRIARTILFILGGLAATVPFTARGDEGKATYMCEIVQGDSSQLLPADNLNVSLGSGFTLHTARNAEGLLDLRVLRQPVNRFGSKEPKTYFNATIEPGPSARPILLPLEGSTLECRNQNLDALVWSMRALKAGASATNPGVDIDASGPKRSPSLGILAPVPTLDANAGNTLAR